MACILKPPQTSNGKSKGKNNGDEIDLFDVVETLSK